MYDISKEFNEQTPGNFLIFSRKYKTVSFKIQSKRQFFVSAPTYLFFWLIFKQNPQSRNVICYHTTSGPVQDQGQYELGLVPLLVYGFRLEFSLEKLYAKTYAKKGFLGWIWDENVLSFFSKRNSYTK